MSEAEHTQEPARPLNVIIIGAGISGLTLAIVLRRNGHHVQVCKSLFELAHTMIDRFLAV